MQRLVEMILGAGQPRLPDRFLPPRELENQRVWNTYPVETAQYIALLDKFTIEDEFCIGLGDGATRIFGAGLERVGDLIALSPEVAADRCDLSSAMMCKLVKILNELGLSLGSDVSRWRDYRATVPADFRLTLPYQSRLPRAGGRPLDT